MKRRLVSHQAVAQIGGRGTMLLIHLLLPVLLGWHAFARLMLPWVWLVLMVQPLCDGGLDPLVSREVAQGKHNATRRILALRLLLGALCMVLTLVLASAAGFKYSLGVPLAFWFVFNAITQTFVAMLRGEERMEFEAVSLPGSRLGLLALLCALYSVGLLNADTAVWAFAGVAALTLMSVALVSCRLAGWSVARPTLMGLAPITITALPMIVITSVGILYLRVDSVMLSALIGNHAMSVYQPAKRLVEAAFALPSIFVIAVFPSLSRSGPIAYAKVKHYAWRMMGIGIFIFLLLVGFGHLILWYLYGAAGQESLNALYVLSPSVPLVFVGTLLTQYLVALGQQARYAVAGIAALLINISLNWLLIPILGLTGAACTTVATELFVVVVAAWLVQRTVHHATCGDVSKGNAL